ncbi:MAG: GNAT family N-acetyltransferase [Hyphomonadaceae bacterium]|nr:GNAT family N-acetyltransferase [Hyphomonadaceae bacterium]
MDLKPRLLDNPWVTLAPLASAHREATRAAASDPAIWRHWPRAVLADFDASFDRQLGEQADGSWIIHSVLLPDGKLVGQTCYLALRPEHAGVEVGGTWYAAEAQGGFVNPAAKLLMLGNAFECGAERVELKTDALNVRSRAAMLKMGAAFEGIHRRHMRRADGTWRDTAWFSVIREDWPTVKAGLEARLAAHPIG